MNHSSPDLDYPLEAGIMDDHEEGNPGFDFGDNASEVNDIERDIASVSLVTVCFSVLHRILQAGKRIPPWLLWLLFIVESAQTVSLAFSATRGLTPLYETTSQFVSIARTFFWVQLPQPYLLLTSVAVCMCLLCVLPVMIAMSFYRVSAALKPSRTVMVILFATVVVCQHAFALPLLSVFFNLVLRSSLLTQSDTIASTVLFCLSAVTAVIIGLLTSLLVFEKRVSSKNPFAMSRSLHEIVVFVARIGILCLETFVSSTSLWLFLSIWLALLPCYLTCSSFPFHNPTANIIRSGSLLFLSSFMATAFVGEAVNGGNYQSDALFFVFVALIPLSFAFSALFWKRRIAVLRIQIRKDRWLRELIVADDYLQKDGDHDTRDDPLETQGTATAIAQLSRKSAWMNSQNVDFALRFLITEFLTMDSSSALDDGQYSPRRAANSRNRVYPGSLDVSINPDAALKTVNIREIKNLVDVLFGMLRATDPENVFLYLEPAFLLADVLDRENLPMSLRSEIRHRIRFLSRESERMGLGIDRAFQPFLLRQLASETFTADDSEDNAAVVTRAVVAVQKRQNQVRAAYARFWKVVLNPHSTESMVTESVAVLEQLEHDTERMFRGLCLEYSQSTQVLRAYARFLIEIRCDRSEAQQLLDIATQIEESRTEKVQSSNCLERPTYSRLKNVDQETASQAPSSGTSSSAGGLSVSRVTERPATHARRLRIFAVITWITLLVFLSVIFGISYKAMLELRTINDILRVAQEVESGGQLLCRHLHSSISNAPVYLPVIDNEVARLNDKLAVLADGLSFAHATVQHQWYEEPFSLQLVNGISGNTTLRYGSLWTAFSWMNQFAKQYTAMARSSAAIHIQTSKLFSYPAYVDVSLNMPRTVLHHSLTMMQSYQREEEEKLYQQAVVIEATIVGVLAFLPLFILPLLLAILLIRFRRDRLACIMLFEEVPKSTIRQCLDASISGSTIAAITASAVNPTNGMPVSTNNAASLGTFRNSKTEPVLPPKEIADHRGMAKQSITAPAKDSVLPLQNAVSMASSAVRSLRRPSVIGVVLAHMMILLLLFAAASIGVFLTEYLTWEKMQFDPAEIVFSGRIESFFAQSFSFALTIRNAEYSFNNFSQITSELQQAVDNTEEAYRAIRYGNPAHNLPGIANGRTFFLNLLYGKSCPDSTSLSCDGMEQVLYSVTTRLRAFSESWMQNSTFANGLLDAALSDFENFLRPKLNTFSVEMAFENYPVMVRNTAIAIGVYVGGVILLTVVFVFCIVPACNRLYRERKRLDSLLVLLPRRVILRSDDLRGYLVDGDDLLDKQKEGGAQSAFEDDALGQQKVERNAKLMRQRDEVMQVSFFEEAPDAMVEISDTMFIIRANKTALALFGLPSAQLLGQHVSILVQNRDVTDRIQRSILSVLSQSQTGAAAEMIATKHVANSDNASANRSRVRTIVLQPEEVTYIRGNDSLSEMTITLTTVIAASRTTSSFHKTVSQITLYLRDTTVEKQKSALIQSEKAKSEGLLLNILPRSVAYRLSKGETDIADFFESVTILFLDLSGFTAMSSQMTPQEVVSMLNDIFSGMDEIAVKHGVERIKLIGDAFLAVCGLPEKRPDHARTMLLAAMEFVDHIRNVNQKKGTNIDFRIGVSSGPVIAGVIGSVKFAYDIWGDSVNTASRMESTAPLGRIQVSRATYELTYKFFDFEERGLVQVKGKGEMVTYLLTGLKELSLQ
jgi:class 3 adenylate cyclase/PAS domain-containing protein